MTTTSSQLKALAIKLHKPARRHTSEADYKLMLAAAQELKEKENQLNELWRAASLFSDFVGYNT